jgi:hypothetical protein
MTREVQGQLGRLFAAKGPLDFSSWVTYARLLSPVASFFIPPTVGPLDESLIAPDAFAISVGLITAGYLLAGQNPAEILKGIGELVPG